MAYSDEVLADSPRAYWRLGSSPLVDATGHGYTLTETGSHTSMPSLLASDPSDGARDFSGTTLGTDFYALASGAGAADDMDYEGTVSFTLECWVDVDFLDTDFTRLISHETATDGWSLFAQVAQGFGISRNRSSSFATKTFLPTPMLDTTYHVVGTYSGTQMRLYLNGSEVGSPVADTGSIAAFTAVLRLGRAATGGDTFDGVIDEVAVYDGVLSDARILAHYNAGISSSTPQTFMPMTRRG